MRSNFTTCALALAASLWGSACATSNVGGEAATEPTVADIDALEVRRAAPSELVAGARATAAPVRARAARALGRVERAAAAPILLPLLADADATVRATAAFAAGQLDLAIAGGADEASTRASIERALLVRLKAEAAPQVRAALLASLGRVGDADARAALIERAAVAGPERALALTALGVNATRRGPQLQADAALRAAVVAALGGTDADKNAAGYALFRQAVVVDEAAWAAARGAPSQALVHVARALAIKDVSPAVVSAALLELFANEDWRVRVEAVRALRMHPDVDVGPALELLKREAQQVASPGVAHVVSETCASLAVTGAATATLAAVELAVAAMPPGPTWAFPRCTCAGVVEVLGGPGDSLERCSEPLSASARNVLSVDTVARARISSHERTAALAAFFALDDEKARGAAAAALCENASEKAADAAATRLLSERDPGVVGALLGCFEGGEHAGVVTDRTLGVAAAALTGPGVTDAEEALVALARLAHARPSASELRGQLAAHSSGNVRDAANGVAFGDRGSGPRAIVTPAPSVALLPLAAVLRTTRGEIVIGFDRERAPRTVKTFVDLAKKGTLNNTPFHRVLPAFVSQGGDPRGDGTGGPGFSIPCERSDASFGRGTVGIAHSGTDTGGSQFFLTHADHPHLDGRYTAFAFVTDGFSVMDSLQRDDLLLSVDFTTALRPRGDKDH